MSVLVVEGARPLEGSVKPSGSKDSAVKLIIAALLSNEDVVLENVPRTSDINVIYSVIEAIGGTISWIGDNKLSINGSTIHTHEVPFEIGSKSRFSALLAGPLIFRFGKAVLPRSLHTKERPQPINRWIETWKSLGINVSSEKEQVTLEATEVKGAFLNFKISTHTGTANALLTAAIAGGETTISNAAEETEVDDLISFINEIGGEAERVEPRKIRVVGKNVFSGGFHEVQPDSIEAVAYATAGLITKGNLTIRGIKELQLTSFVNFLTKMGARYEYDRDELNVWYGGEEFKAVNVESSPAPGFLADWLPFATLLLNFAEGESQVHDTIYVDRFSFSQDLNRMGGSVTLKRPTELGLQPVISDESYDYASHGEPKTVAVVNGPVKLRGARLNMDDPRFDAALIIAALGAEGKSELIGVDEMFVRYERFFDKLNNLGASISQG